METVTARSLTRKQTPTLRLFHLAYPYIVSAKPNNQHEECLKRATLMYGVEEIRRLASHTRVPGSEDWMDTLRHAVLPEFDSGIEETGYIFAYCKLYEAVEFGLQSKNFLLPQVEIELNNLQLDPDIFSLDELIVHFAKHGNLDWFTVSDPDNNLGASPYHNICPKCKTRLKDRRSLTCKPCSYKRK